MEWEQDTMTGVISKETLREVTMTSTFQCPKTVGNTLFDSLFSCTQLQCKPSALPPSGRHVGSWRWCGLWFDKLISRIVHVPPETLQLTASIITVVCKTVLTVRSEQLNPFPNTLQSLFFCSQPFTLISGTLIPIAMSILSNL